MILRGLMAFSSEQIVSSIDPVTGEHLRLGNDSDDTRQTNVTIPAQNHYQYQSRPVSPSSPRLSTFHDFSDEGTTTHNLEATAKGSGSADEKSEFALKKSTTIGRLTPQRKITSDFQRLSLSDGYDSHNAQSIHRQDTSVPNLSPEQAEQITAKPLSEAVDANIVYDFGQLKDLFHAQQYSAITLQLNEIDTTTFNECTLDHYDFIAAFAYQKLTNYTKAIPHLKAIINRTRIEQVSSISVNNGSLMEANHYLGSIHLHNQDFDLAAACFQRARDCYPKSRPVICNTFGIKPISASTNYHGIADCLNAKHNVQGAIEAFKLGIIAATTSDEKISLIFSLANLLQRLYLYQEAADYYSICIKIAIQADKKDKTQLMECYGNIGNTYLSLQQLGTALESFDKALFLCTTSHNSDPNNLSRCLNNLGTAYQVKGKVDKAHKYYKLAFSQALDLRDVAGQTLALGNIGNIYSFRNKPNIAQKYYQKVIRIARDDTTTHIAKLNLACAQYDDAKNQLEKIIAKQPSVTLIRHSDFVINFDTQCHLLKTSPEVTEVEKPKRLLLMAIDYLEQTIKYEFAHIPNTIDRYKNRLLKPALNRCIKRLSRHIDCLLLLGKYEQALAVAVYARETCILTECQATTANSADHFDSVTFPLTYSQIVKAIKTSNRPTSIVSFTGERLSIWFYHQTQNANPMMLYVFPSNDDYLNLSTIIFLKDILHSKNGITRLINQKFTDTDRNLMKKLSVTIVQINTLIKKLEPFISKINSVIPSEEEKLSILWIT